MPVALCATHEGRIIAMLRVDKPSNLGAWITASTKPFRLCFFQPAHHLGSLATYCAQALLQRCQPGGFTEVVQAAPLPLKGLH